MDFPYLPYLDWIDTQKQSLLQNLREWVAVNTFSSNTQGLAKLLSLLQSAFQTLGGESQISSLPSSALGQALIIRKRPQAPIQVLLGGHMDTVFSPSDHFQQIEEQGVDRWKGPGITDMKGGIAILLLAIQALERSPIADQIGWEILLTPDEEIGSPGSTSLYQEAAHRHHVGLIFEPSFPDGAFVSERKGSATYFMTVRGKEAHVGRDFEQGRSAVFAIAHFIHHLETWQDPDFTINVTNIESKGAANIVPSFASCFINFRSSCLETLNNFSKQLYHLAKRCEQEGIQFEITQRSFRPPKPFDKKTQNLFNAYASCAQDLKIPFQTRKTGGVCDGNILAEAGLPTLDTAGAVGGGLHTSDEYILLSSLTERAKLAALFLLKLAAKEILTESLHD